MMNMYCLCKSLHSCLLKSRSSGSERQSKDHVLRFCKFFAEVGLKLVQVWFVWKGTVTPGPNMEPPLYRLHFAKISHTVSAFCLD